MEDNHAETVDTKGCESKFVYSTGVSVISYLVWDVLGAEKSGCINREGGMIGP
jgi:hypothetical protein